jgi:hypothetical protein
LSDIYEAQVWCNRTRIYDYSNNTESSPQLFL